MEREYIVYREVDDLGPNGSRCAYIKVHSPNPGERVYHGQFVRHLVSSGQFDGTMSAEYRPVGPITSEVFQGGVETL